MKKRGTIAAAAFMVCISVFLSQGHGYTISLTRNYIEHYASATVMTSSGSISPPTSYARPYAEVDAVDTLYGTGAYAHSGRGFADDVIRDHYRIDANAAWSDAAIRFYGESRYGVSGAFGNIASGVSLSRVQYDLMLAPQFGAFAPADVLFSIAGYANSYPAGSGLQKIGLKDADGNALFSWEDDFGLQDYAVKMIPAVEYSLWIESHGDFSSPFSLVAMQESFASDVELLITAQEDIGIPLPPSALLLGVSLVSAFAFRKRLLLS